MADPLILPTLLLFLISNHVVRVSALSDYKICGDSECESLMSRVQARKHYKGPDCRFLNFRKGDVIFVYYKLTGKRDDLWAGSIDKQFGHFHKEAVDIQEIYAQEEVTVATQAQDFFCDEYGTIIKSDASQWDNQEYESEVQRVLENEEHHPKQSEYTREPPTITQNNKVSGGREDSQRLVQAPSDNSKQKSTEQGGSYWIGSQVTAWLGLGGQSNDDSQEHTEEQDSFKSRKLALDMDGNQLQDSPTTQASGWLEGGLTNIFGFSQRNAEVAVEEMNDKSINQNKDHTLVGTQNVEEALIKEQDESVPGSSWVKFGINDILRFGLGNAAAKREDRHPDPSVDETIDTKNKDQSSVHSTMSHAEVDQDKTSKEDKEETSLRDDNIDIYPANSNNDGISVGGKDSSSVLEGTITKGNDVKNDKRTVWYNRMYDKILGFNNEKPDIENEVAVSPNKHSQEGGSYEREKEIQEESGIGLKSVFPADAISSVFGSLLSRNQLDNNEVGQNYEVSVAEIENKGKEVESQNNSNEESKEDSKKHILTRDNIDQPHFIQPLLKNENDYKAEPSDLKLASNDISDSNVPVLQQNSEDYSAESNCLDRGIERQQNDPECISLESMIPGKLSDIKASQLQQNTEEIDSVHTETEQKQAFENLSTDENSEDLLPLSKEQLHKENNLNIFNLPQSMTDDAENVTDLVVIQSSSDAAGTESTGMPNITGPAKKVIEETNTAVALTKTLALDSPIVASKLDIETDSEGSPPHQIKDHSSENNQSPTTDHGRDRALVLNMDQMDTLSSQEVSVHKEVEKSDFNQLNVQDPHTDETKTNIVIEGGQDKMSMNMISNNEDNDITKESIKREDKGNVEIANADVKEVPQEQNDAPSVSDREGLQTSSNTEKEKEEFTSTSNNMENDSDGISNLELRTPNEQNKLTNQRSPTESTNSDLPIQSSSLYKTDGHENEKSQDELSQTKEADVKYEMNENQETKHRNNKINNGHPSVSEGEIIKGGPNVLPTRDHKEIEKYSSLIQEDSGKETLNTSTPKDNSDLSSSEPNDLPGKTTDVMHEQIGQQKHIHLREIQSDSDIKDEKTDLQEVKGDSQYSKGQDESTINEISDHQMFSGSHRQTETCMNSIDGGNIFQTSPEQEKCEVISETLDKQVGGFNKHNIELESLATVGVSLLTESDGDNPDEKSFIQFTSETEQFPGVIQSESSTGNDLWLVENETEAGIFSHESNRDDTIQTNFTSPTDNINSEPKSEEVELLSKIYSDVIQEPSDQTEKNVGHHEANFISNKEEGFSPKSHSKYYKNTFLTADENSVPCLLKDSNEDSSSTSTKHMGNMDPLKKDTDILSMEPKDYTEGIPQPKKNREEKHIESATLGIKLQSQATHSRNEDLKATQVSEGYRSMQLHFSNEDIDYFLDLFGKHKLLWIDYYLSNNGIEDEAQNNNYDQAILSDVEQILQYHSEIIYSTKITQADGNTKGEDIQNKSKPLKKLEALLSILRSRYTTGKPDVTVNMNPGAVINFEIAI